MQRKLFAALLHCGDAQLLAVFGNGAPRDVDALLLQQAMQGAIAVWLGFIFMFNDLRNHRFDGVDTDGVPCLAVVDGGILAEKIAQRK